jgi:hypothetical protein
VSHGSQLHKIADTLDCRGDPFILAFFFRRDSPAPRSFRRQNKEGGLCIADLFRDVALVLDAGFEAFGHQRHPMRQTMLADSGISTAKISGQISCKASLGTCKAQLYVTSW